MRKNKLIAFVIACVLAVSLCGCREGNLPLPEEPSNAPDYHETVNTQAESFEISYYNNAEIKNCADGIVLVDKTQEFKADIVRLNVVWGDENSSFDTYSPLTEFTNVNSSQFEFVFNTNSLIPSEATKIWVEAFDCNNYRVDKGCVGVEKYKQKNSLLYEFQVISDQQISGSAAFYRRSKNTFADIKENSPNSAFIAVNGDVVDEAKADNYDMFFKSYRDVYSGNDATKLYIGLGNHEFIIQSEDDSYGGVSSDELARLYNRRLQLWKDKTGNTSPYYSVEVNGSYLIFLGTTVMPETLDGNTRADCTLGKEQLEWLKAVLEKADKTGKPIYLFSHGSLRDTVSGSLTELNQTWYGYTVEEEAALRKIIGKYPQLLFFSGHSHWSFESKSPYVVNCDAPSFFNTAAIGYLWQGSGGGEHYDNGTYENGGAQGLYVEVYEEQLFIRGRQFEASDGKSKFWFSGYQVVLPLR